MKYEEMLEKAEALIPKKDITIVNRYDAPKVVGHIEGNKTIIANFNQICDSLRCQKEHLLKYLQRELATPGKIEKDRLILGRKLNSKAINDKISEYADNFVLCYECKKPDTKIIKEGNFLFLKCMACGAKSRIKIQV